MEMKEHGWKSGVLNILLIVLVAVSVAACDSFEENAYRSIKTAATAYNESMKVAADYRNSMDDATKQAEFWAKVEAVASPVRASLRSAKTVCKSYSRALAAYKAAKSAAEAKAGESEPSNLEKLESELAAAKASATAALNSLDSDALSASIQSIIDLFKGE